MLNYLRKHFNRWKPHKSKPVTPSAKTAKDIEIESLHSQLYMERCQFQDLVNINKDLNKRLDLYRREKEDNQLQTKNK